MKAGDLVKFVEYHEPKRYSVLSLPQPATKLHHLNGKIGVLIEKVVDSIADDWGAVWSVLVEDKIEGFCYERWMEVINGRES